MRKLTLFLLMTIGVLSCMVHTKAQTSIAQFTYLESQGKMPADFKKILETDKDMSDYNILLRELIMDGRVLYGTKLNDYVNTIADNLLKDDPALRSKIHIYIVKSPIVNASATSNGLLFINLGLLAQISNESELAFVMAHEISHYVDKHVDKINNYKDTLKGDDLLDNYVKYHSRSREQEMAADRMALERFFKQSSYSYSAVEGIFDVLQYADLPFDEVPFPKSMVETDFYQFPAGNYLATVSPIKSRADMVDTLFTHPNIERRRAAARQIVAKMSDDGRSVFVQPEELFNEVRELARFECLNCYLTDHEFDQAFYNAYVLQQEHPDNAFLEEVIVSSLYGFSKHKNHGNYSDVIEPYKDVEGEMQQTSYFFSKLGKYESSLLALRAAWNAKHKYPDNRYYSDVLEDVMNDVFVKNKMKYQDFSDYPMGTNPDSIVVEETENNTDTIKGKYGKIKSQKQYAKVVPTAKFKTANFMLVDIHRDPEFISQMEDVINAAEDKQILDVVAKKQDNSSVSLVIAEPQCEIRSHKGDRDTEKSLKYTGKLSKTVKQCARRLRVSTVGFSDKDVCNFTTEQYNGYAKLQRWMREYIQSNGFEMYYNLSKDMSAAYDLTGTTKVCVTAVKRSPAGFISSDKITNMCLGTLCPYAFPMSVAVFALPRYRTEMYMLVIDFETGKTDLAKYDRQVSQMSAAYVNDFMYRELYKFVKGK